jgi:hypothetical protein
MPNEIYLCSSDFVELDGSIIAIFEIRELNTMLMLGFVVSRNFDQFLFAVSRARQ